MTAEQLKDKKFVALYLSERWGTVERFKIQRHKAVGNWLFVKCQEKYFYDEDDYIGNNPTYVYSIPLHNGTVSGEIYDEHDPDTFDWAKAEELGRETDWIDQDHIRSTFIEGFMEGSGEEDEGEANEQWDAYSRMLSDGAHGDRFKVELLGHDEGVKMGKEFKQKYNGAVVIEEA
mgnify:CR=1 FL=1